MRLRTPSPPPDLAPAREPSGPTVADNLGRRRRRATWQTRLRRAGIAAAVLGVLGLATWVVGYSDLLSADEVRVVGVGGPLADTVTEAAGVAFGQPLARVDTARIATDVEAVPDVASATVTRGWPCTVVVTVSPRVPVVSLAGDDGWYRVDSEGVLFAPGPAPAAKLPVLVAPADAEGLAARTAGVSVADALPRPVRRQVERIEASSPVDVRLVLRDGRVVVWGSADEADLKAEVLAVLLDTPAIAYDVSVPDRPTLRPVTTG
jgi:cell division protein FtsQ